MRKFFFPICLLLSLVLPAIDFYGFIPDNLRGYVQTVFGVLVGVLVGGWIVKELFLDAPLVVTKAFEVKFITFEEIIEIVSSSYGLTRKRVLRRLLTSIYDGVFKDKLYMMAPTENGTTMQIGSTSVPIKGVQLTEDGEIKLPEKVILIPSEPQKVEESHIIGLLSLYTDVMQELFPQYKGVVGDAQSFNDLKKMDETAFSYLRLLDLDAYKLAGTWTKILKEVGVKEKSIFLSEVKKMGVSGKAFHKWLKKNPLYGHFKLSRATPP